MVSKIFLIVFLAYLTYYDCKNKSIRLFDVSIIFIISSVFYLINKDDKILYIIILIIFLIFFVSNFIFKNAPQSIFGLGIGDYYVFLILLLYFRIEDFFIIFIFSILLFFFVASFLRKKELAFIPFITIFSYFKMIF